MTPDESEEDILINSASSRKSNLEDIIDANKISPIR